MSRFDNAATHQPRSGMSLLELLAAVAILGVLAAVLVPRLSLGGSIAKSDACTVNCRVIELQATLWKRAHNSWPAADLSDLASDATYLPEGLPVCPVDGSSYTIDAQTGVLQGHAH